MMTDIPESEWVDKSELLPDETLSERENYLPPIEPLRLLNLPNRNPELISGVLREKHVMMLSAPSKAGKTWCLIELAVAIATGSKWLGRQCSSGRVLYIDGETDANSLLHRFDEVARNLAPGCNDVTDMIDILPLRGKTKPLNDLVSSILKQACNRGYVLVIVDPAYPFMDGNENSTEDVRKFFTAINEISEGLNCAVAFDHHHGKGAKGNTVSIDRASGSGMFSRAPDAIVDFIELVPTQEQCEALSEADRITPAFRVSLTLREFKYIEPFDVWFRWPVHVPDTTGTLAEWEPRSETRNAEEARRRRIETENLDKTFAIEQVIDEMRAENGYKPIPLHDLCVRAGIHKNDTARGRIARSEKFKVIHPTGNTALVVPKEE